MQLDSPTNLHIHSPLSLRGESALKISPTRSLRISTRVEGKKSDNAGATSPSPNFPSFGMAAEALQIKNGAFRSDEDLFKSASAPEKMNAFPAESSESQQQPPYEPVHSSPAHAFLSMFSSSVSTPAAVTETVVAGYTLEETIGHGGFSTVKKGVSSTGEVVAVKRVRRADLEQQDDPDECRRQLDNEIEIWRNLNHEHILPLFAVERTVDADYFVTLLCPAGSLFDILKRDGRPALPQDDAGMLFRQVVRGLRYLHETAKLVHGDIKLENVLVDDAGMCRITDFGLSKRIPDPSLPQVDEECHCLHDRMIDHTVDRLRRYTTISHAPSKTHGRSRRPSRHRATTAYGTDTPPALPMRLFHPGSLPYASPEMLSPPSVNCHLHMRSAVGNPAQDMWALGVLLYALLCGRLPFADSFEPRLQMKILHGTYDPPIGIGYGAESVLRGCLERAVSDRWTVDMVDDVAWGVGWGTAGDVSAASPDATLGSSELRRSRSRSKARPYPDHLHGASVHNPYGNEGSVFSSSVSRSRSRAPRTSSKDKTFQERLFHSPSIQPSFSMASDGSSLSNDLHYPYPSTRLSSRGRRSSIRAEVDIEPALLRSASISHSRSHSNPSSPATPSDIIFDETSSFQNRIPSVGRGGRAEEAMSSVYEEKEAPAEVPRGRRRAAVRREKGFTED